MDAITVTQAWLMFADMLGMLASILALYILVLNPRKIANRLVFIALGILTVNTLAAISLFRANTYQATTLPTILLVAIMPSVVPTLFVVIFSLFKPAWLMGKMRWIFVLLASLTILPWILTLLDVVLGTSTYYVPLKLELFNSNYFDTYEVLSSGIGILVNIFDIFVLNTILIILLLYLGFFDRSLTKKNRGWSRILLIVQILIETALLVPLNLSQGIVYLLISSSILVVYGFAAFQHFVYSPHEQVGKLQTRLTTLMVIILIPALAFLSTSLIRYMGEQIKADANSTLKTNADFLVTLVDTWFIDNTMVLQSLATQPGILSMDPTAQKPVLEAVANTYQYMYLISTTDLMGMNVARSDDAKLTDYKDRIWYQNAVRGDPLTLQLLIGRTTGQPALVASMPVYSEDQQTIGVVMFASLLTDLSDQVLKIHMGETGFAYLIDDQNHLVAHPELQPGATELTDYSDEAPVKALRQGITPPLNFNDENGVEWQANYMLLENGWAVVVQQQVDELLLPYRNSRMLSLLINGALGLVIIVMVWAFMRQAIQPINSLTAVVKDIASGNLDRVAPVEGDDEVGTLAKAFNIMTNQVRSLVSNLEQRVAERTLDLEHRSAQLQAAAEVGHAAATIRNLDELLPVVTRLISERFGFYHVGIFLVDDQHQYALLRATNSPGGQRMLERGHKLRIGQQGIVGYVTSQREPRIVLNVGEDTAFFNNPDLPDTQSEMALPLLVGNVVLGALDVQSIQPNAFTEEDIETLQVLADQVATAIYGVQLLQQTEGLLERERRGFGVITGSSWLDQIRSMKNIGYTQERSGLRSIASISDPLEQLQLKAGHIVIDKNDSYILYVPISIRNQVIGVMNLVHDRNFGGWTDEEIGVMQTLVEQLGLALESARAYQQTQIGARRDRILGELSARVRETLDVQTILSTATKEIRQVLDLSKVVIHLGTPPDVSENGTSDPSGGKNA